MDDCSNETVFNFIVCWPNKTVLMCVASSLSALCCIVETVHVQISLLKLETVYLITENQTQTMPVGSGTQHNFQFSK